MAVTEAFACEEVADGTRWAPWTLLGFRFGVCYFGTFGVLCVLGLIPIMLRGIGIPISATVMSAVLDYVRMPVSWIGSNALGLDVTSTQIGSDSAFQWSVLFCLAALSGLATVVWSIADVRTSYTRLYVWTRLFLRFVLAAAMFYFGMAKLLPTQMPVVLNRLIEPFGDFSPTGVLWAQISVSPTYEVLLGAAEVIGGLLLLVPRTAAAGALLCMLDMTQVFVLNMTYDIRLKSVSSHLLLLSLFLLAPHVRRLTAVLLSDKAIPASVRHPFGVSRRAVAIQVLVGLALLGAISGQQWQQWNRPTPALYGIWQVHRFSLEGYQREPLLTDHLRWRRVVVDRPFHSSEPVMVTIQHMDDSFEIYGARIDPRRHIIDLTYRIELGTFAHTPTKVRLTYWFPGPNRLIIDGRFAEHQVHTSFDLKDVSSFPLTDRGFHWVQEDPYIR
ncbi:hypothetical protein [Smaragdicoccus niigatensis]|uniref:hypothetical protein n=1 Tax=Smaragdicoccus niigatensis TaxID=359359 RepID=UPI00035C70A7|nr:hypothetical protein [Smaragdicoccus niigatensis]